MKMKRLTVMLMLLIISIACVFSMNDNEKQTTIFRVHWSKTVLPEASIAVMEYGSDNDSGSELEWTMVGDIKKYNDITLDPTDSTTAVPAFTIMHTTNRRGYHTVTITASKFKKNDQDSGYGYTMVFPETDFTSYQVGSDDNALLRFFVNCRTGFVSTFFDVDIVFDEFDNMNGLVSSEVTIACSMD